MVDLYQRQKQIVKFLMDSEDYQPVKIIAEHLKCSVKTVRNDLDLIKKQGVEIEKKSGKGVKISLKDEERMDLNLTINKKDNNLNNLSTESRRIKILFDLLDSTKGNVSIQSLAQKYYVSKTSIVNDLKNIEEEINKYNLFLQKSVHGTKIVGSEIDIRRAIVNVLNGLIVSNEKLINLEKSKRIDNFTLKELLKRFSEENVNYVEKIIEETEELLEYKIGEPYYINLITHILILINRTKSGNRIYELENSEVIDVTDEVMYAASKRMADSIEKYFSILLERQEIYSLYRYLISSGAKEPCQNSLTAEFKNRNDLNASIMAKELIEICSEVLKTDLTSNTQLYNYLTMHLRPMLNRINYSISIKNTLLNEIRNELSAIMGLIKIIMLRISKEFGLVNISEDEIGYIAVYFQAAIEETISRKRVIVVCSTGIGTSHLLKNRIKNHFPDWIIVDVISASYLEKNLNLNEVDLIISTVKLENSEKLNKPIAYVTALFNKSDTKIISDLLIKEKMIKETKFKFDLINRYLKDEYISIFNEVRYKDEELVSLTSKKMFSKEQNNEIIQYAKLSNDFNIYLYEKSNITEPFIGMNIIKNFKEGSSRIQLILVLNKNDYVSQELITELYQLFSKKELLQKLYKCNTGDEVLKNFV